MGDKGRIVGTLRSRAKRFGIVRSAYRSSRAVWVARRKPEHVWREGLPGEVDFWEEELPARVAEHYDYQSRADPNAPMRDPYMNRLIARIPEETISIIDVGAGPLTALGRNYPGKILRITATDPLAAEYGRITRQAGIEPPTPLVACRGEDLLRHFQPGEFDIAFARNAIDHSVDPVCVITNMVDLVKDGRFVVLKHLRREAQRQYYRGLHQWNFDVQEGEFVIWRPRQEMIHMNRVLNGTATIEAFVDERDWVICLITKRLSTGPRSRSDEPA